MSGMPPSSTPGGSYTPPPPPPPGGTATPPSGDRQLMLVLAYLGILGLIPLIVRKDDREVKWHAINGLLLFAAFVVVSILWGIFNNFMPPGLGCALSFVGCGLWLGWLVLAVLGIMKALKGERFRMPMISDVADKQ